MSRVLLMGSLVVAGCAANPYVVIERQAAPLASVSAEAWRPGGLLVVAQPGTLAFPHPLALRITLADPASDTLAALPITAVTIESYGSASYEVATSPACVDAACTAELRIIAAGASMLRISATGDAGTFDECVYYASYEDADPGSVIEAKRSELEAQQQACAVR